MRGTSECPKAEIDLNQCNFHPDISRFSEVTGSLGLSRMDVG